MWAALVWSDRRADVRAELAESDPVPAVPE
jgi:hypothetical protein